MRAMIPVLQMLGVFLAAVLPVRAEGGTDTAVPVDVPMPSIVRGPETGPAVILESGAHLAGAHVIGRDSSPLGCAVLVRGPGVEIADCVIEGGPGSGVLLLQGGATLRRCTIRSSRDGITARMSDATIESTAIERNADAGVDAEEASSIVLRSSRIARNGGDGLVLGALSSATFDSAMIVGNLGYGVRALFAMPAFDSGGATCSGNGMGDYRVRLSASAVPTTTVAFPEARASLAQDVEPALTAEGFSTDDLHLPSDRIAGIAPAAKLALDSPLAAVTMMEQASGDLLKTRSAGEMIRELARIAGETVAGDARETTLQNVVAQCRALIDRLPMPDDIERAMLSEEAEPTLLEEHYQSAHEKEEADRLGAIAQKVPLGEIIRLLSMLADAALGMDTGVARVVTEVPAGVTGTIRAAMKTDAGWLLIGDTGPNSYPSGIAFIFDLGGNDHYEDPACADSSVSIVVDYGGDDEYDGRICSARRGFSVLIDFGGNDRYRGGDKTECYAVSGGALLWERDGDDQYEGARGCQAAAIAGVAILADDAGRDLYSAGSFGQAAAGPRAYALLTDRAGDDHYVMRGGDADVIRDPSMRVSYGQGFAIGLRPGPAGGVALLLDGAGDDFYRCDIFGQGVGYWGGLGTLIDAGGSDMYRGYYYVQGAGVHLAAGMLIDEGGRDYYQSWTVSQGCGLDLAFGALVDQGGDDLYRADNLTQGAASSNGIGLLFDRSGNDRYMLDHGKAGQGYGVFENLVRRYGSLGLFVDLEGTDVYSGVGKDGSRWTNGELGIGWDK